jgi:hypothetical protein
MADHGQIVAEPVPGRIMRLIIRRLTNVQPLIRNAIFCQDGVIKHSVYGEIRKVNYFGDVPIGYGSLRE